MPASLLRKTMFGIVASAAISACGPKEEEKPGGVSKDEAAALDAAAEILDKRPLPDLPEAAAPAQPAPAPSAS
ncbi:hypothetical protein [Novosphingobium sp. B1]|uniref:hypothetical protein n=1 Tax=Novosphingobium sp. B1 TaxID=1938756 RepID=UPI0009FCDAD4|nr:hypothetical protein [Novosphingobium sp. B1]